MLKLENILLRVFSKKKDKKYLNLHSFKIEEINKHTQNLEHHSYKHSLKIAIEQSKKENFIMKTVSCFKIKLDTRLFNLRYIMTSRPNASTNINQDFPPVFSFTAIKNNENDTVSVHRYLRCKCFEYTCTYDCTIVIVICTSNLALNITT